MDSLNLPAERAFPLLDSVYGHFSHPGIYDRIRGYDYKGQYFFYQAHDMKNAMVYVDSCLSLLSDVSVRNHYARQYAKCLIDKAETYQLEGQFENAFYYYRKGLEAIRDVRDSCAMAEYTQRVAMASYRGGRYGDARNLFELALRQFASCHGDFRAFAYQQSNLDNIGESYVAMGKWDSASFYFDSTITFINKAEGPYISDSARRSYIETARAVVYGNQGDCMLHRGDTARAWALYQRSIEGNMRPLHDSGNALIVLMKATGLQLAKGRLAESREALAKIRMMLDKRPDMDLELSWRKLHSEWLAKSGNFTSAWESLHNWTQLKDSLHTAGSLLAVDVPSELVHLEDRYTIELLQERDQMKTVYLVAALIIVLMLATIAFLVRRNARKSSVHIRQLNRLNKALRAENRQTQTAINALNEDQAMYLRSLKTIAHDLRNPVGAISSAVTLLQNKDDVNGQTKTMLQLIHQAADQSLHLVNGIMQLDLPMGSLKKETLDLEKLLANCVATLQFKAGEKQQQIVLNAEPVTLSADHDKLWRVIINLLDNAIKFSPLGAEISMMLSRVQENAVITVSDKGIGIPKGMEDKLFAVDGATKRTGTAGEASFGLGLAIVSQIIRAHGGVVQVESEVNKGTTFRIELPI